MKSDRTGWTTEPEQPQVGPRRGLAGVIGYASGDALSVDIGSSIIAKSHQSWSTLVTMNTHQVSDPIFAFDDDGALACDLPVQELPCDRNYAVMCVVTLG